MASRRHTNLATVASSLGVAHRFLALDVAFVERADGFGRQGSIVVQYRLGREASEDDVQVLRRLTYDNFLCHFRGQEAVAASKFCGYLESPAAIRQAGKDSELHWLLSPCVDMGSEGVVGSFGQQQLLLQQASKLGEASAAQNDSGSASLVPLRIGPKCGDLRMSAFEDMIAAVALWRTVGEGAGEAAGGGASAAQQQQRRGGSQRHNAAAPTAAAYPFPMARSAFPSSASYANTEGRLLALLCAVALLLGAWLLGRWVLSRPKNRKSKRSGASSKRGHWSGAVGAALASTGPAVTTAVSSPAAPINTSDGVSATAAHSIRKRRAKGAGEPTQGHTTAPASDASAALRTTLNEHPPRRQRRRSPPPASQSAPPAPRRPQWQQQEQQARQRDAASERHPLLQGRVWRLSLLTLLQYAMRAFGFRVPARVVLGLLGEPAAQRRSGEAQPNTPATPESDASAPTRSTQAAEQESALAAPAPSGPATRPEAAVGPSAVAPAAAAAAVAVAPAAAEGDVDEEEEERASGSESATCLVCLDRPWTHGFLHGGSVHIGVCGECLRGLQRGAGRGGALCCPVCRSQVERPVALFT